MAVAMMRPPPTTDPGRQPGPGARETYRSNARWAKPMPKSRPNFIPAQSWLEYNWLDKDPELEFVLFAIEESGRSPEWIERETEAFGHKVSRYTLLAWFYKGTRQPKNVTMNTVMAAIGWERPWRRR